MKKSFKILILLMFFFCGKISFTQNPIYYIIGKNELNNINIYSVLEAENSDIYLSSNNGLYKYNNGTFFKFLKPKNQKGNSLFSLVKTSSGAIFCSNLKGQVFKVQNNRLELFYTIPKEFIPYFPYLLTDEKDNLVIVSKRIDIITSKGKKVNSITKFTFIDKNINGKIVIGNSLNNYFFLNQKEKKHPLPFNLKKAKPYYQRNLLLKNLVAKDTKKYHFKTNTTIFTDDKSNSILTINPTTFLVRELRDAGVLEIKRNNNTFETGNIFFKETFISSFTKGKNGTLYLGTFKQGLLVIPNYDFKAVKTSNKPRSIIDFDVKNDNEIYMHTRGKKLLHYNNTHQKTTEVSKEYVNQDVLCNTNIEFQKTTRFSDVFIQSLHKNKDFGSVKDIAFVSKTDYLAATSIGLVFKGDKSMFKYLKKKQLSNNLASFLTGVNERCFTVKYHSKTQTIYVGTQNKLLSIRKGVFSEITYKNKSIIANSLVLINDELFIGTEQQGVLKHHNNTTRLLYDKNNGLADNLIKKIALKGDYLFVLNTNFLQYINLKTGKIKPLNKSEGIVGYINEFHLSENKLWVLTNNTTIMVIALPQLKKIDTKLHFQIDSLQVNDQVINTIKHNRFSYHQNNFNFFFQVKNDSYREQSQIKYHLKGFDDTDNTVTAITKSVTYKKLPPGNYTFTAYAKYSVLKSNSFTYSFTITPPFWKTIWFTLFCVIIGLIFVILFFKYRINKQEKKAKEKLKQQQVQTDLIEAKLTALRSQMNPHFIFNALNSIQNLILKQDSETSYDYVVLFSKLVRNTLNYSEEEFITLEKEIEFLDVYLQLEKLRFGDDFTYKIDASQTKDLEIPPLLIQPFVENSLLHGLLSKKGKKKLTISFYMEENLLVCEVIDNGIGRKKSAEIQSRQGTTKKSFALTAIQKRLDILKQRYQEKIGYTFIDLYENNISSGTKVIIVLPYKII